MREVGQFALAVNDREGTLPPSRSGTELARDSPSYNATGLVAAGVDVKTAQGLLGHSDSRLRLDHYAQVVTDLREAAAAAMGARFSQAAARDGSRVGHESGDTRRTCADCDAWSAGNASRTERLWPDVTAR